MTSTASAARTPSTRQSTSLPKSAEDQGAVGTIEGRPTLSTDIDLAATERISVPRYLALVTGVLQQLSTPPEAARDQAAILLEGDLRGHPSHGLRRLDIIVQRIRNGLAVPSAVPFLSWPTAAVLLVDGRRGLGPPTAFRAVDALANRVATTGIAVAAIREANHLGMLAPYVERLAAAGLIGLGLTTSEALVHPWGGTQAMVGTNPVAIAVPTAGEPVVLDMATGQISMGKVLDFAARGVPLPSGVAVDENGQPTTDARAAACGAISPFGGAKGYALSVALEALVGVLTRTSFGRDIHGTLDATELCTKGDLFVAIDPAAFGASETTALDTYLNQLRESAPAPGHDGISVPGDRARRSRLLSLSGGVPLPTVTWHRAMAIARDIGCEFSATPGDD